MHVISVEYTFDFAYINQATMKACNIELGDTILVKIAIDNDSNPIEIICTCWPSNQLELTDIALSKVYLNINGIDLNSNKTNVIVVKPNRLRKVNANTIDIELIKSLCSTNFIDLATKFDNTEVELIQNFLKEIYLNKFVLTSRQYLYLNYMGQKLIFKVTRITDNEKDLAKQFEKSLSISNESSDSKLVNVVVYGVNSQTKFVLRANTTTKTADTNENMPMNLEMVKFINVAGLDKEIQLLKEFFIHPFDYSGLYKQIGTIIYYYTEKLKLNYI